MPGQTRPGYSFVDERSNGLADHARWLYRRILGDETRRNIMIDDGLVMFLTSYHKMQYATGSRLVGRFLREPVGDPT